MGFLGDVTTLDGTSLRPHDIDVALRPTTAASVEGTVARLARMGFHVRATVLTDDGEQVTVETTRAHADALGLFEGTTVFLTAAPPVGRPVVRIA
jgi:sulfate transport system ATP-binding protein